MTYDCHRVLIILLLSNDGRGFHIELHLPICHCREEKSLVDQFVFEVLVIFIESLALAHADERSLGNYSFVKSINFVSEGIYVNLNVLEVDQ